MEPIFDSLAKSTKTLMFKEPFYGMFLISLNKDTSESIPTACVSKNNINCQLTINPTYWNGLDEKTKVAVLKHELLHIVFFHILMQKEFDDHTLLNIAADLEVNQYIEDDLKGEKWEGLELSHYKELNLPTKAGTRKYYELLQQVNKNRQQQGIGVHNKNQQSGGQATMDDLKDMLDRIRMEIEKLVPEMKVKVAYSNAGKDIGDSEKKMISKIQSLQVIRALAAIDAIDKDLNGESDPAEEEKRESEVDRIVSNMLLYALSIKNPGFSSPKYVRVI